MTKSNELSFVVVDDDDLIRYLHNKILEKQYPGCHIETFEDGKKLAEYNGSAHLYLVDNRMKEMNGLDALDLRRTKGDLTPALLISGTPQDLEGRTLPANTEVLNKPYELPELIKIVGGIIVNNYGQIERA